MAFRIPPGPSGWGGVIFAAGDLASVRRSLEQDEELAARIESWSAERPLELGDRTEIATDDWPYIYLESRRIPLLYYLLGGLMLALMLYGRRRLRVPHALLRERSHWHFFFLGAAFLLLEVQNVSKAAVALGNTWVVNAVIISAILVMILLANAAAARWPGMSMRLVGALLLGSCVGLWFVELGQLASLPFWIKGPAVGALTTLPMFFAGILFVRSFATVERKDHDLGANLFGALVGGLLQSLTFVTGLRALLLIVALLYLAALLTRPAEPQASRG
jgi:hypothetical protein